MALILKDPDIDAVFKELSKPTTPRWRLKTVKKGVVKGPDGKYPDGAKGAFIPYIDARYVQQRLDDVVGPQNWESKVAAINTDGSAIVRLGICINERWIWREDIGYPNNPESKLPDADPLKGAVSDGLKRAAVQFGIGRFLYAFEPVWTEIDGWGKPLKPIKVGFIKDDPALAYVDVETGEIPDAPPREQKPASKARAAANDAQELAGEPASWTGVRAFWRNKIDGAGSAPALDKVSKDVMQHIGLHDDRPMFAYLNLKRVEAGLAPVS